MPTPDLDATYLSAGQEFGDALAKLGLDPHALFWAYDTEEERHVLVLVTDFFDLKGPLEISRQLFRAYNASITPQEIDPFVVRLHSINQPAGQEFQKWASSDGSFAFFRGGEPIPTPPEAKYEALEIGSLVMKPAWTLRVRPSRQRTSGDLSRLWKRFTRNVDRAAA